MVVHENPKAASFLGANNIGAPHGDFEGWNKVVAIHGHQKIDSKKGHQMGKREHKQSTELQRDTTSQPYIKQEM